jgi:hypothetical protein
MVEVSRAKVITIDPFSWLCCSHAMLSATVSAFERSEGYELAQLITQIDVHVFLNL